MTQEKFNHNNNKFSYEILAGWTQIKPPGVHFK